MNARDKENQSQNAKWLLDFYCTDGSLYEGRPDWGKGGSLSVVCIQEHHEARLVGQGPRHNESRAAR